MITEQDLYFKTKLNMINNCLLAIGEVPLPSDIEIDTLQLGSDAETAKRIVERTMIEVQTKGWFFNTDYDFDLIPDIDGFISLPPNVLRVDFGKSSPHRYTIKDNKIYDYKDKTFLIKDKLKADIVWLIDYAALPTEAYEYISTRAARKFQQTSVGSIETDNFLLRDEQEAYLNLERRQLQSQDYNLKNHKVSTRVHNGYLISGLYNSTSRRNF